MYAALHVDMKTQWLTWHGMWCGDAWHMWCETPPLPDPQGSRVWATEAGYVRFDPSEYPHERPPTVETILAHVPVLRQQLALKLASYEQKHRTVADNYQTALQCLCKDSAP